MSYLTQQLQYIENSQKANYKTPGNYETNSQYNSRNSYGKQKYDF